MIYFLAIAIIVLSVLLGMTASLLYITVISPVRRKKTAERIASSAPVKVKELINFLNYDGSEQEWTEE